MQANVSIDFSPERQTTSPLDKFRLRSKRAMRFARWLRSTYVMDRLSSNQTAVFSDRSSTMCWNLIARLYSYIRTSSSRSLAQRRKGAKAQSATAFLGGFLCAFAPLREKYSVQSRSNGQASVQFKNLAVKKVVLNYADDTIRDFCRFAQPSKRNFLYCFA